MAIPSLAMIPSGYKDGKVYSVLPTSGDGDFTFSRGSNATRVNSSGLIETMPLELGSELVTNGGFDTDSDWTLVNNTGTDTEIESGYLRIETDGAFTQASQNDVTTSGKEYKLVYTILNSDNGSLGLITVGNITSLIPSSVGTHIYYFTAHSTSFVLKRYSGALNVEIDNLSVKEVLSGLDLPRLDYSDSSCPSLLLEPQRTNLIEYSEDFSNASWTKTGVSVVSDVAISPDGSLNAFKLVENTSTVTHKTNTASVTSNIYTISVFAKYNGRILQLASTSTGGHYANFDLLNGVIGNFGATTENVTMTEISNGWYRCSMTTTSNMNTAVINTVQSATSVYQESYTGDGTSGIYIFGAQLEEGSYATSYIPTNGAIATRLADVCNDAGTSDTFNDSEGVLMVEMSALADDLTGRTISLSDGTTSNTVRVQYLTVSNSIWATVTNVGEGGNQAILQYTSSDITTNSKVAIKYKENDFALWVNGLEVATDTSGVAFSANTLNTLQFDRGNGSEKFYGNVKDVRVYNTSLTNEELQALTS